jgi:divalent metal cation (Fe/Co/Zn/Cd) transporter
MERTDLLKRSVKLEYLAIGLNAIGALAAGMTGIATRSIAFITFSLNSIIGTVLTVLVLRRFRLELRGKKSVETFTGMERKILFAVGISFFLLALYSMNESGSRIYYREKPETNISGLVLSGLLLIGLPVLAVIKLRMARSLESRALRIDAWVTGVCVCLVLVLFMGIVVNVWVGWWWLDSVSVLLMLPLIFREGWESVEVSKKGSHYGSRTTRSSTDEN